MNVVGLKVALVHDWLVSSGGGERVLKDLHVMFEDAPIYTLVYDRAKAPSWLADCDVRTTYLQNWPGAKSHHRLLLPFMPCAWEELDLSEYDVVISSCSSCCKGVITRPGALHICYCHSPIRYAWDMRLDYLEGSNALKRFYATRVLHRIRMWDYTAAQRVDAFVSNSDFVGKRINKYYNRRSTTIYPGVHIPENLVTTTPEDYYLFVGRCVKYKRADLAVLACSVTNRKLVVVSSFEENKKLRAIAGPTIEFRDAVSDDELASLYSNARALLFPGLEDFGLVPVEAMSVGCPVIAYGYGGATETVIDGQTGLYFAEQSVESLLACIDRFEHSGVALSRNQIREYALTFSQEGFRRNFAEFVWQRLKEQSGFSSMVLGGDAGITSWTCRS